MIYFLNKGLILEQEVVKALQQYFNFLDIDTLFPNYTLNITNEHPFALLLNNSGETNAPGLFPAIVVTSETDEHNHKTEQLIEIDKLTLEPADTDKLTAYGYMIDPAMVERIRGEFAEQQELYGMTYSIRRSERISLQIWSENVQLKNLLYEMTRLFVLGGLREWLEGCLAGHNLVMFGESVTGQRSGTYTDLYGVTLAGANIVFDVDYCIEQSVIDTKLRSSNDNLVWEVINHVKGYEDITRSRIIGSGCNPRAGSSATSPGGSDRGGASEPDERE